MHTKGYTKTVISHSLQETNTLGHSLTFGALALRLCGSVCPTAGYSGHIDRSFLFLFWTTFVLRYRQYWVTPKHNLGAVKPYKARKYTAQITTHTLTETTANVIPDCGASARAACRFAGGLTGGLFHCGIWLPEASLRYWWMTSDTYGLNIMSTRHLFCWKVDKQ